MRAAGIADHADHLQRIVREGRCEAAEHLDELVGVSKTLKEKGINPFGNGTATAWQNETIVGALLSAQIGAQFEQDVLARGEGDFTDAVSSAR